MTERQLTNLDRLRILGEALHGPHWRDATARDLGIHDTTIDRWCRGRSAPRDSHVHDLIDVASKRLDEISAAIVKARLTDRLDPTFPGGAPENADSSDC